MLRSVGIFPTIQLLSLAFQFVTFCPPAMETTNKSRDIVNATRL